MTIAVIIILISILATVFYFVHKGAKKVINPPIKYYVPYVPQSIDFEIHRLINEYRINSGLSMLSIESRICDVAASHCRYMAKKKTPSHDYAGERQQQFPKDLVGEIVGYNYPNAASVVAAWKASPGHNNIITSDDYNKMGLAVAYDDVSKPYFTVIFTS